MKHRKALFWVVRNGIRIRTISCITNDTFPEAVILLDDVPIQPGDKLEFLQDLGSITLDLESD